MNEGDFANSAKAISDDPMSPRKWSLARRAIERVLAVVRAIGAANNFIERTWFGKTAHYLFASLWLIFPLVGLVVLRWTPKGMLVLSGDFGWPVIFRHFFEFTAHTWDDSINLGYSAARQVASFFPFAVWGRALELTGLHPYWVQATFFYIAFTFSGLGMYILARRLRFGIAGGLAAGALYMFGPFSMFISWNPAFGLTFPFYTFLPLSIFFYLKVIEPRGRWMEKALWLFLFAVTPFGISFANISYLVVFLGLVLLFFLFAFSNSEKRPRLLLNTAVFFAFFLAINAPLIMSFIADAQYQFAISSNKLAGLMGDYQTARLNSVNVQDAFRMSGFWVVNSGQEGEAYYPWRTASYIYNQTVATYAVAVLAALTLLARRGVTGSLFLAVVTMFLLGTYIIFGFTSGPLISLPNEIMFGTPFVLRGFRALFLKIGPVPAFALALIAGRWFDLAFPRFQGFVFTGLRSIVALGAMSAFVFFSAQPFFTGDVIKPSGKVLAGYNVRIPQEYFILSGRDAQRRLEGSYLALPLPLSYNYTYWWEHGGYLGGGFLRYLLSKPLFYVYFGTPLNNAIIEAVNKDSPESPDLFGLFGIRYVIQHKDIQQGQERQYRTHRSVDSPNLKPWFNNRYLRGSTVPDNLFRPRVYPARSVVQGDDTIQTLMGLLRRHDNKAPFLLLPKGEPVPAGPIDQSVTTEFRRVNGSRYAVRLRGASGLVPVVFNEACHSGWNMYPTPSRSSSVPTSLNVVPHPGYDPDVISDRELRGLLRKGAVTLPANGIVPGFVSRLLAGSVQNNNLPEGSMFETWFRDPIDTKTPNICGNLMVNTWMVDTAAVCADAPGSCVKRDDGTWDVDLTIEFEPDRLATIGRLLQGAVIGFAGFAGLAWIFIAVWARARRLTMWRP